LCGTRFDARAVECPSCGLDPKGPLATELRELEITTRHIQALVQKQALDSAIGEQIYRLLEARQTELIRGPQPVASPDAAPPDEPVPAVAVVEPSEPARQPGVKESAAPVLEALPAEPVPVPPPIPPRRSLGEMLAGFMEERNILWGELVGGLLIVGCSIALVISLWRTLEQIPFFPFLIFASITAALFAAGHYTLRHWKLESTSRGLLVIATLLTPLDFLVLAGLSRGQDPGILGLVIEGVSLVVFAWLVRQAARVLVGSALPSLGPRPETWLTLAVLGGAGSQLLVPRWLPPLQTTGPFLVLAFLPAVCQVLALAAVLLPLARRERLEGTTANALFLFLGQATFTVAVALGFLAYWSEDIRNALHHLPMPIALAGLPVLITGALVHRLLEHGLPEPETAEPVQRGLSPGVARLVGTLTTWIGALVLLAALRLGWPHTDDLIVVGTLNALAFTVAAFRYRLPSAHIPALFCLAIASLTAFHGLLGHLGEDGSDPERRLLALAVSPSSGSLLAGLAVVLALAAELETRWRRPLDALHHVGGAAVAGGLALVLVGRAGVAEPGRAAVVFAVCGLGCWLVNLRLRREWLSHLGAVVLLGAAGFVVHWSDPDLAAQRLALLALLIEATLLLLLSVLVRFTGERGGGSPVAEVVRLQLQEPPLKSHDFSYGLTPPRSPTWDRVFAVPFRVAGLAASAGAVLALPWTVDWSWLPACCLCTLWLAALWLMVAWFEGRPEWFQAFQAALTVAVLLGVSAWLHAQPWVGEGVTALLRPWSLQVYALALAVLSLAWSAVRRVSRRLPAVRALVEPGWRTVAEWVLGELVGAQFLLVVVCLLPEVVREYAPGPDHDLIAFLGGYDFGLGWVLLGLLALTLTLELRGPRPHAAVLAGLVLGLTVPLLAASAFREEWAAASALRWGLSLSFLVYSGLLWARRPLGRVGAAWGIDWPASGVVLEWLRAMLLVGAVLPVLLLTWWVAFLGFSGRQPAGPVPGSVFASMGWTASTVTPLLLLVLGLLGHGVRENFAGYIASAGYLLAATLMGGYALGVVTGGGTITGNETAFILQLGTLVLAGWGLGWLATGRWRNQMLLDWQFCLALLGCLATTLVIPLPLLLSAPAVAVPAELGAFLVQAGHLPGWTAFLGTLALGIWITRLASGRGTVHVLAGGGFLVGILAACTAARWDGNGWLAYRTLSVAWTLVGLLLLACGWAGDALPRVGPVFLGDEARTRCAALLKQLFPVVPTRAYVEAMGLVVVLLALGESLMEPVRSYWACATPLAVSVLLGADAIWSRRPLLVYVSGLLFNVSGYLLWRSWLAEQEGWDTPGWQPGQFTRLLTIQIACLGVGSSCWSLLELQLRRLRHPIDLRGRWVPFVHAAVQLAVHLLAMLVLIGVAADVTGARLHVGGPVLWVALLATLVAAALCLWDPEATWWGFPLATLSLTGLLFLGLLLHGLDLSPHDLARVATPLLAGYLAATSAAVWLAPRSARLWRLLGIPPRTDSGLTPWFLPAQTMLSLLVLGLSLLVSLNLPSLAERLSGPAATALLVLAGLFTSACWPALVPERSDALAKEDIPRQLTLMIVVLTALEIGWAWLGPDMPALWLHRSVLALIVLSLFALLYRSGLAGRQGVWATDARRQGTVLGVLALGVLVGVLLQEFWLYDPATRHVPLAGPAVFLVACLLGLLLVGALVVAAAPRWDPFALGEKGRFWCVYGAEALLVLLLVHLRLNVPDWFPGFLSRNWAVVLMVLGFVGVGLAELLQRRGSAVLAGPLRQTGLFLPLLPLIAFLVRPLSGLHGLGEVIPGAQPWLRYLDRLPAGFALHALLWFLLGVLYALVAILRRSTLFALLGALAATFGLWVVYANVDDLAFLLHPQFWLIPLGLILLWAEHLEGARLSESQRQGVRYLGLLLIYLSSTADMFIIGLGNSVVWPVVLAVLSILGVLAGIGLRVRAFLLSGVAFLFLVVFAQIWHAAVDRKQTWVWWASGIVLGAAILGLFGLFEKRRNDVVRVIEDIKGWR
jgi:hypothetical protein